MEHNPPRERNNCHMTEPIGDVFEEQMPMQKFRARKPVKVCFMTYCMSHFLHCVLLGSLV